MKKQAIARKISQIKRNIDYYSKVYSPNSKKVKELKDKLEKLKKEENLVK